MIVLESYFILFGNCIPVKGAARSIICDLQNNNFKFIPNDLYYILLSIKGKTVKNVLSEFASEDSATILEYFSFLEVFGFGFFSDIDESEHFPQISFEWDHPSVINNAIIDYNEDSKHNYDEIFMCLQKIGCSHIQLRGYSPKSFRFFEQILEALENTAIISAEFIAAFHVDLVESELTKLIAKYPRIHRFIIHSSIENLLVNSQILFVSQKIKSSDCCGHISPEYFTVNIKAFTESMNFNSCLNRKMSIDVDGNLKNCPSMLPSFGKFSLDNLKAALQNSEFQKYWKVSKDNISVCKDCEFRHICSDCRAFTTDSSNALSKPLKCSYDPYTATWQTH